MANLIEKFLARWQVKQSIGWTLNRADDHILRDIGLTRADVQAMIDGVDPKADPAHSLALEQVRQPKASLQRAQVCGC